MGGACSRPRRNLPLVAEQPGGLAIASPRRVAQPQAVQRIETGNIPLPLLELTIRCVSEHIETFPDLHLPSEIAQRVLAYLLSRAWLNVDTFVRLQHCLLLSLELPNFAPLSEQGGEVWLPLLVKHTDVARLDISYAAEVTDAAFRRVATLASLTALNISGCVALSDAALAYVARLLSLKQLKMDSLPRITDDGLVHLWPLRSLQWLSVSGCDSLGPAATSMLVEKGGASDHSERHELRHLVLRKSHRLTDDALAPLCKLSGVRHLQLGWCGGLTSEGVATLAALDQLTQLELSHTGTDDASLRALSKLQRLRDLSLRGCAVTDGGIVHVKQLRRLKRIDLHSCPVGDAAAASLSELPALEHLEFGYTEVSDTGLLALSVGACASKLRSLGLDSCKFGATTLQRVLPLFRSLCHLDLSDVITPHLAGESLRPLTQLVSLNLFNVPISDHEVAFLSSLPNLADLNLDSRSISDGAMPAVAAITSLTRLDLFGARITDAGLKYLRPLVSLRHIELCGGGVTDSGVAELSNLFELRTLNVSQNGGITDASTAHLRALVVLESLNLSSTNVGVGGLANIQTMNSLTALSFYGCSIPRKAAASLRASLPRLHFLGLDP